jgi:nucleotide-binding universal stress UspA family protein
MSIHKILIPLDGSEFSRQILPQIHRFLNPANNKLILLRVAPWPHGVTGAPARPAVAEWPVPLYKSHRDAEFTKHPIYASQVQDSLVVMLKDELQVDAFNLERAGYTVSIVVRFGNPAQKILDFIREEEVDLVAMTTHGRTGLSHLVFGSVAERVLHGASVPIVLLRPFEQPASVWAKDEAFSKAFS